MKSFNFDEVLQVTCSAHRILSGFDKAPTLIDLHKIMVKKHFNLSIRNYYGDIPQCVVIPEDINKSNEIISYFQRLHFSVLGDNYICNEVYEKKMIEFMNTNTISSRDVGWVSNIPFFYKKYQKAASFEKIKKDLINECLQPINSLITQVDCKIIIQEKCKNYDGYNVIGVIDNHLVSWYSTHQIPKNNIHIKQSVVKDTQIDLMYERCNCRLTRVQYN
jgi:hypothetical protein